MSEGDIFRAVVQVREAWQRWLSFDDEGGRLRENADELYETFVALAEDIVPEIHPIIALAAEANLIQYKAEDDRDRFLRFGAEVADESGMYVLLRGNVLYEASPRPPSLINVSGDTVSLADLVGSSVVSAVERLKKLQKAKNLTARQRTELQRIVDSLEVKLDDIA